MAYVCSTLCPSIADYGLYLWHAVSFNNWLWPMVCGTLCPSRLFPKSYHYECVHQLGGNFSIACFSYTQILLLLGFTGGYVSLTCSLSLVLLTNVSLTYLLFPKLHFCFLWRLCTNTFILLFLLYTLEFYIYWQVTKLFTNRFVCFTVTEVLRFIFNHTVMF